MSLLAGTPPGAQGFQVRWVDQVVVLAGESGSLGWAPALLMPGRVLVMDAQPPALRPRTAKSGIPGAVVEVTDALGEDPRSRVYSFMSTLQPSLVRAFRVGESSSVGAQVLAEYMSMNPDNPRPPSIPPVFYNCLVPEALKNGITVNSSGGSWLHLSASPNPRQHIELYPRR